MKQNLTASSDLKFPHVAIGEMINATFYMDTSF